MSEGRPVIVVAERYGPPAIERLRQAGAVVELETCDAASLEAAVREADALLIRSYAKVPAGIIAAAKRLRVIGRAGVGLENIDLDAARKRGVIVVHTPGAATDSVAQQTFAYILALVRKLGEATAALADGRFLEYRSRVQFRELGSLTMGIIGMGRIGSTVGRIAASGFAMRVLYNDIVEVGPFDFPTKAVSKEQIYEQADIVTLHVPLTPLTRGLIDAAVLASLRPDAILINTSRGAVVDTAALAEALAAGRLGGAGLDVFEEEPPPADHPIMTAPNAILTPHISARTDLARERMEAVVEDVIAVLEGRPPAYPADRGGG